MSDALNLLERPYKIESTTWGQSVEFSVNKGMLMVTACDFDSGQVATVGIALDQIDVMVEVLSAVRIDTKKLEEAKASAEADDAVHKAAAKEKYKTEHREKRIGL